MAQHVPITTSVGQDMDIDMDVDYGPTELEDFEIVRNRLLADV